MVLDKKGFTLIELLATMVILAAIMVIAVPNVMGILNNSKANAYVDDAKKLLSLAQYKLRGDPNLWPANNECIVMTLSYLDNSEFGNAPNGGSYDKTNSYVLIKRVGSGEVAKFNYYVTLDEKMDAGHRGIKNKSESELNSNDASDLVENGSGSGFLASSTAASQKGCSRIKDTYSD